MTIPGIQFDESELEEVAQPLDEKKIEFALKLVNSLDQIIESVIADEGITAVDIF